MPATVGTGDPYLVLDTTTGIITRKRPIQTSAGAVDATLVPSLDGTGKLDPSFMPVGVVAPTQTAVASGAIADGDLVNTFLSGGVLKMRKADASVVGKEAVGYVLAAVADTATGTVFFDDLNTHVTGLTIGSVYYLSETVPGGVQTAIPSTNGHILQRIGEAMSATVLNFVAGTVVAL